MCMKARGQLVGLGDQIWVLRLGVKHPYLLGYLAGQ